MQKIASFIVDKRRAIIAAFIIAAVLCVFTANKVRVEDDIYEYLPENTETKQGLDVMEDFVTYSTARILVEDVSCDYAEQLAEQIADIENIKSAKFSEDEKHYNGEDALIEVTFAGGDNDEVSTQALDEIRQLLEDVDGVSISTDVGYDMTQNIVKEMATVGLMSVCVVIALLLFTSRSYAEVIPLVVCYGMSALLQLGTNFLFKEISFISNSVTLVLQLALAIDYSVILCNIYASERRNSGHEEAMTAALTKAIPEIMASSLTTIGGLLALTFMQFEIGRDVGFVLIKAIFISLLTVFMFLPGMLLAFANAIDRTKHRSLVPRVDALGNFAWKTRNIVPPIFALIVVAALFGTSKTPLMYNYAEAMPIVLNESAQAKQNVLDKFGYENMMAVVVPAGDYETEAAMLDEMSRQEHVTSVMGIASVEVEEGLRLIDKVTIDDFAELADLDSITSKALFVYYAAHNSDYDAVQNGIHDYEIPIMDLFEFLYDGAESGSIELDADKMELVETLHAKLQDAQDQLQGKKYDRMLVYADLSVQTEEAHNLVTQLHEIAASYYGDDVYVVGEATCARDLEATFQKDNLIISGLSALFVVIVIFLTFRSVGLSVLLIAVIQGSIWINFAIPAITGGSIYFLAYLIVIAMQMGANIDYAIVVSNRYIECREIMPRRKAIIVAMNNGLATIITSGSILATAGILIALFSSTAAAAHIGLALGRGTIISVLVVLLVLPQILLWGDKFILNTTFRKKERHMGSLYSSDFEEIARQNRSHRRLRDDIYDE